MQTKVTWLAYTNDVERQQLFASYQDFVKDVEAKIILKVLEVSNRFINGSPTSTTLQELQRYL